MRATLRPLFGEILNAENLEIVGAFCPRLEEHSCVTIWPQSGTLQYRDRTIEIETIWVKENLKDCGDFHSLWSWFPVWHDGRFFNLSLFWWANYYHWFNDVLPRLHMVLERFEADLRVILPRGFARYQEESLNLIGVPPSRCLEYTGRRPLKVERLLYASPVAMTGDHDPQSIRWMSDRIRGGILGQPSEQLGRRRLYVTRRRAACRRIVNEVELLPILNEHGFETVECESLSFREQVRLFSEASIVVGPHGGGLTNTLWCGRGATVFEIQQPHAVRRCYWSLARALGHNYFCGIGDASTMTTGEPDVAVHVDEFQEGLKTVISSAEAKQALR
jgi:capsular polysaccharide biosynthesis protein